MRQWHVTFGAGFVLGAMFCALVLGLVYLALRARARPRVLVATGRTLDVLGAVWHLERIAGEPDADFRGRILDRARGIR